MSDYGVFSAINNLEYIGSLSGENDTLSFIEVDNLDIPEGKFKKNDVLMIIVDGKKEGTGIITGLFGLILTSNGNLFSNTSPIDAASYGLFTTRAKTSIGGDSEIIMVGTGAYSSNKIIKSVADGDTGLADWITKTFNIGIYAQGDGTNEVKIKAEVYKLRGSN